MNKEIMVKNNGRYIPGLRAVCARCGTLVQNNEVFIATDNNHHDGKLCFDCMSTRANICIKCSSFYNEHCKCNTRYFDRESKIVDFSYMPKYKVLDPDSDIQLGVEFEFYNKQATMRLEALSKTISESTFNNFLIVKWDGSIRDRNGIELVTHIISPDWITENRDSIHGMFKFMLENGFVAATEPTCGGHVHYSSSNITNKQLFNILLYFGQNPTMIRILSQRPIESRYCIVETQKKHIREMTTGFYSRTRNSFINMNNIDTVEFRFFSGISSIEKLDYAVSTTRAIMDFGHEKERKSFRDFVSANKDKYQPTWEYLRYVRDSL